MLITRIGSDFITINEDNLNDESLVGITRVHLIKMNFTNPTNSKINKVLELYPRTNRYIIENNIRIYNYILRSTSKKYYIENSVGVDLITFFRKNNKVLLNFLNLRIQERDFLLMDIVFKDLLRNIEVLYIDNNIYVDKKEMLDLWNGNVIMSEKE